MYCRLPVDTTNVSFGLPIQFSPDIVTCSLPCFTYIISSSSCQCTGIWNARFTSLIWNWLNGFSGVPCGRFSFNSKYIFLHIPQSLLIPIRFVYYNNDISTIFILTYYMHKVCSFLFVLKVLMNLHCNMNNDSVIDKVEIVQFFLEIIQELFVIM